MLATEFMLTLPPSEPLDLLADSQLDDDDVGTVDRPLHPSGTWRDARADDEGDEERRRMCTRTRPTDDRRLCR